MEEEGIETLKQEGFQESDISLMRSLDMRYVGQAHEVTVPLGASTTLPGLREAFHQKHEATYGHAAPEEPVEIVNLRVGAIGKVEKILVRYPAARGLPGKRGGGRFSFRKRMAGLTVLSTTALLYLSGISFRDRRSWKNIPLRLWCRPIGSVPSTNTQTSSWKGVSRWSGWIQ